MLRLVGLQFTELMSLPPRKKLETATTGFGGALERLAPWSPRIQIVHQLAAYIYVAIGTFVCLALAALVS